MTRPLLQQTLVLLAIMSTLTTTGQSNDLQHYYQEGTRACQEDRYEDCLQNFATANRIRPNHQIIMYHLARAYSLNHIIDSSHWYLKKALSIKADFDLSDGAFDSWNSDSSFLSLKEFQNRLLSTVSHSEPVVILKERNLHIESIALDAVTNRLFLGSVHKQKILEVDLSTNLVVDFINTADHGMWSVFGMQVDPERRLLWVSTVATNQMIHADSSIEESAAVYKFNIDTKQLIKRYALEDSSAHWFGDLTLSFDSQIYVSDSRSNNVYRITEGNDRLELFYSNDEFESLQGLDLSPDGHFLFLADYVNGPYRLSLADKTLIKLTSDFEFISLKSIDGLYFLNNSLIATQNQVIPMRVTRYVLNESMNRIVDFQYLEKGNPILNEPTLGVLKNNWFYYVANSQWGGYDKQNKPLAEEELQDIYIMKVRVN